MKLTARVALGLAVTLIVVSRAQAGDPPPQPVVVRSAGPKAMRVRIAAFTNGFVYPCSSSSNIQLSEGPLDPDQQVRVLTPAGCVCVEHTFDDFPDVNWSPAQTVCRPKTCVGFGKGARCWPSADPTIRITLSSRAPGR